MFLETCGDITVTVNVNDADFILLHGCEVLRGLVADGVMDEKSLGDFAETDDMSAVIDPILELAAARNIPMVCANPDFLSVRPDRTILHMPVKIARRHEEIGGSVTSFGKPHKEHFEACIEQLDLPREKIVHIGDSLHHDVAGANSAGIDCVFVAGGVHREELGCELGSLPTQEALAKLFTKYSETPSHVVPMLENLDYF